MLQLPGRTEKDERGNFLALDRLAAAGGHLASKAGAAYGFDAHDPGVAVGLKDEAEYFAEDVVKISACPDIGVDGAVGAGVCLVVKTA